MKKLLTAIALAAALSVSACAGGVVAVTGAYKASDTVSVTLGRTWSDVTARNFTLGKNVKMLTIDSPILNQFYVFGDVQPGDSLWRVMDRRERERLPTFRADMTSRELTELMSEHLVRLGLQRVEETELAPTTFAGAPAVRVRYSALTRDGLEMSVMAVMANVGGKLRGALFLAPTEYYFAREVAEVEKAIASATSP